ncbi:hypothetical protein JSO61_003030 [Riemerella anatipestifer]|uniref:hypothetical protein n=1 Tax=Riemerella anatipestifer TaxID=34085 RepID=UPI002A8CF909|nr:hypothetical protein [Riemerella anatipestifer]MDY3526015.1 hypothetical protein [Riemerella anatipestifer]
MKKSHTPTRHILVRAYTGSEWDSCDFAIITISQGWKEQQAQRLKVLDNIENDDCFLSVNYRDTFVDFYKTTQPKLTEEPTSNLESLLGDTDWTFVELGHKEQEQFSAPQSTLNCYRLKLDRYGNIYYTAHGKHTGEEFWTAEMELTKILNS